MADTDPGLVVPIRLEALLIGQRDATQDSYFLPPYADFSTLPYRGGGLEEPYLSSLALSQPFTGNAPFPQGIHLHWNLPRALRSGVYDEEGNLTLPSVPNRWLVTRVLVSTASLQDPAVTLTSWVVESDYVSQDDGYSPTTIPQDPAGQTYAWLGRVYGLSDWLANGGKGTYLDQLTALGFGVPDFSSYYPNCRNVFGLYDASLNTGYDPTNTRLAYVVTGWYADPAQDPLHDNPISGADNPYGWLFSGDAAPAYSLYSGAVWAVDWNPPIAYFPDYATPLAPSVALGNTPMEALSALAAWQLRDDPVQNVERVLNALQLGVLKSLDQPDGLATLEEAEYNAEYASSGGGTVWDVTSRPDPGMQARDAKADPLGGVPPVVAQELEQLNDLQRQIDQQQRIAVYLQGQIFADWQKYLTVLYAQDPSKYPPVDEIYGFVSAEITTLDGITGPGGTVEQLTTQADALRDSIVSQLPDTVELAATAAPRFYQANDPVVLLSGDGVPGPPPDDAATLQCVLTDGLVTVMSLPAGLVQGSAAVALDTGTLPSVDGAELLPYPALGLLVQQAQMLNPSTSWTVAAAVAGAGGTNNPAKLDFTGTMNAISAAQAQFLAGQAPASGITYTGQAPQPNIALRQWAVPWNPLAISWRFRWYAPQALADAGGVYDPSFVLDNFAFPPDSLDFPLAEKSFSPTIQQYSGTVLLSPDASISLQAQIQDYLRYNPDDQDLQEILADLSDLPLLAQALGGLDAALLMLQPTMQLPVADPIAANPIYAQFSDVTVANAVGGQNLMSPVETGTYAPLRAGKAVLDELWLVDEFGRYKTVNVQTPIISTTLPNDGAQPPAIYPPLRLAQPARLDFAWLSAADPAQQSTSLADSAPVCGWVVPNHLDDSLMFYDAGGGSIGSLTPSGDGEGLVWQSAPGSGPANQSMQQSFAGANAVLAAFAGSVVDNGAAYLPALVRTFDRTQTLIGPGGYSQDTSTAVLIGTPLAIVQASLSLTLQGLPSPDQGWAALQRDIDGGDAFDRATRGYPQVQFPVFLGSLSTLSDGLVGFFTQSTGGGVDFGTFWAAEADGSDPHISIPLPDTLTVTGDPDAPPAMVTLLVDPRAAVHANAGITPVRVLGIPADAYSGALGMMAFTFLTSPVLVLPGGFAVPVPAEGDGTWTWVQYDQQAWDETSILPVNFTATLQTPELAAEGWLKLTPNP